MHLIEFIISHDIRLGYSLYQSFTKISTLILSCCSIEHSSSYFYLIDFLDLRLRLVTFTFLDFIDGRLCIDSGNFLLWLKEIGNLSLLPLWFYWINNFIFSFWTVSQILSLFTLSTSIHCAVKKRLRYLIEIFIYLDRLLDITICQSEFKVICNVLQTSYLFICQRIIFICLFLFRLHGLLAAIHNE